MDGPVMSASRTAVLKPSFVMATASIEVTVDLPTPPLPLTTAMTFLTCDWGLASASRLSGLRSAQASWQLSQLPLQFSLICILLYSSDIARAFTKAKTSRNS
jgi:hypothetical protein